MKFRDHRRRVAVVCEILVCCRVGPVLASVIVRRCNLCNDTFHFFGDELVRCGFLSKSINHEQTFYGTTRLGLDFLRKFGELQELVAPLEQNFGKLLF